MFAPPSVTHEILVRRELRPQFYRRKIALERSMEACWFLDSESRGDEPVLFLSMRWGGRRAEGRGRFITRDA